MTKTSPVRCDEKGIFVLNNGQRHRPREVAGYSHAYRMDDAGLQVGDRVIVRNVSQSPLCKIITAEGLELRWHSED